MNYICKHGFQIAGDNPNAPILKDDVFYRVLHAENIDQRDIPASVTAISDDAFTGAPSGLLIVGKSGSKAEAFAKAKGYSFKAQ